jgi:exopolysaccharide biosynthesis galactosyltransferase PssJ
LEPSESEPRPDHRLDLEPDDWRGIMQANEGADLPDLPERFSVERVTFPPNDMHERGEASLKASATPFAPTRGAAC